MADKNMEEEYLDSLLKSMMDQEDNDSTIEQPEEHAIEEVSLDFDEKINSDFSNEETNFSEPILDDVLFEDDGQDMAALNDLFGNDTVSYKDDEAEAIDELDDQAAIDQLLAGSFGDSETDEEVAATDEEDALNDQEDIDKLFAASFGGIEESALTAEEEHFDADDSIDDDSDAGDSLDNSSETDFMDSLRHIVESSDDQMSGDTDSEVFDSDNELTFDDNDLLSGGPDDSFGTDFLSMDNLTLGDNAESDIPQDDMSDLLALEDGMSFDDIPNESLDGGLSSDEMEQIASMDGDGLQQFGFIDEDIEEESSNSKKGKKSKKAKKNKKSKKDKVNKEKKKFSLKDFFMVEDDDNQEDSDTDLNQQLIDELYRNKDSLDGEIVEEQPKKEKKKKEKKEKKEKPAKEKKPKKEKAPKEPKEKQKVDLGSIIKGIFIAAVICVGIIASKNILSYKTAIKDAREAFNNNDYRDAYESIHGMSIKSKDSNLAKKIKILYSLDQSVESYENYLSMYDNSKNIEFKVKAIDALINAVGRKNSCESEIDVLEISSEVSVVYSKITFKLAAYDIDEETALMLYSLRDKNDYLNKIRTIGGLNDSNN